MDNKEYKTILDNVHKHLKGNFTYITDLEQYGTIEDWRMPTDINRIDGDCDDFALACRILLRKEGIETRLVVCTTEDGEGHLICMAGQYVLDNRQRSVKLATTVVKNGYKFYYASGLEAGDDWHKVVGLG